MLRSKTLALLIPVVSASKKIEQSFILDENFLIKACQARKRRSRFLKVIVTAEFGKDIKLNKK